jgi:aspartokinase
MIPLIHLADQISGGEIPENGLQPSADACAEITGLTDTLTRLFQHKHSQDEKAEAPVQQDKQLAAIINEGTNLSNGIINYAQLLTDSCQDRGETSEEKMILAKIIAAGERIAAILKKI